MTRIIKERRVSVAVPVTLMLTLMILFTGAVSATGIGTTRVGIGTMPDTLRCGEKVSHYRSAFREDELYQSLEVWKEVINECPEFTEEIFTDGEEICKALFIATEDNLYIDLMIMTLTLRSHYFGNNTANDLHKAELLFELAGDDPGYLGLCYNLLAEAVENSPEEPECSHYIRLAAVAASLYAMEIIEAEELEWAFITSINAVESGVEKDLRNCNAAEELKDMLEFWRTSGAMTCAGIEKLYGEKIDNDYRNIGLIMRVHDMLIETDCRGTALFYNVALKIFANNRSAENALRLAELNIERNDRDRADSYFMEAYKADTSRIVRSGVLTRIALMNLDQGRREEARNRAEQAWELNNSNGKALKIIADSYAGADLGDPFENHAAYWVAVDYLRSAAETEPTLSEEAGLLIKEYSKLFPTREECFYRRIFDEGVTYTVGGWVSEVTRVRFRKE